MPSLRFVDFCGAQRRTLVLALELAGELMGCMAWRRAAKDRPSIMSLHDLPAAGRLNTAPGLGAGFSVTPTPCGAVGPDRRSRPEALAGDGLEAYRKQVSIDDNMQAVELERSRD